MPKTIQASLDAKGLRIAVVAARFNGALVSNLITGALDCLARHGAADENLTVIRVPGSFEIPLVVQRLASARKHDAIVALGVLLRGETPHFDLIAAEVTRGLLETARTTGVPVAFGILTAESSEQAADRAGGKMGNRHLKWAFSEASILYLRESERAKKYVARLEAKHGKGKAISILSAKLGRAVYFILRRREAFDEERFFAAA